VGDEKLNAQENILLLYRTKAGHAGKLHQISTVLVLLPLFNQNISDQCIL